MGFQNIGEVIAGYIATRPEGRRIVIDGTGDDYDQVVFYSGNPAELAPGSVGVDEPFDGTLRLTMRAPKIDPTDQTSRLDLESSVDTGGSVALVSSGDMSLVSIGPVVISSDGLTIDGGGRAQLVDTTWKAADLTAATLLNGWTPRPGGYAAPAYSLLPDGRAWICGAATPGTLTNGTVLFTLPAELRPTRHHSFECPASAGGKAMVQVESSGNITVYNATAGITWLAFGNVCWPPATY